MIPPLKSASLVFAGGGTGGHLFPAIAIADRISELLAGETRVEITFVGTKRGVEYRLEERLGYPLRLINVRGITRSLTLRNLLVPFLLVGALWRARSVLKQVSPDIVIGTGGYVSWPVLKMASLKRIITVLQEQNSYPGIATRRLALAASRVYLGFEEARGFLPDRAATTVTGNPVRGNVTGGDRETALKQFKLDPLRKTILVLGGSQGARSINQAVLRSLEYGQPGEGFQLLWQTGKRGYKDVVAAAGERAHYHSLFPFEDDMKQVYAAADVAVARAGAITLAELEACRLPAILIPYPHAAGDHQRRNAKAWVDRGLAEVIDQDELDGVDPLARAVRLAESGKADQIHRRICQETAGRKPAVDVIAEDIIKLIARVQEGTVEF